MVDPYKQDLAYAHTSLNGDLQTAGGQANLRAALLRRWVTEPGTFAYRPKYGAGLLRFQNQPMTVDNQRQIAKLIEDQTKLEKRVQELVSITFAVGDEIPGQTIIKVVVKPIGQNELTVNLPIGA